MSAAILPHFLKTKAHYNNECSHPPSLSENKGTLQWWVQPFSLIVWKQKHSTMMSAAILPHCLKTKAHYNDECSHSPSLSENKGTLQWWVQPFSLIVWKQRHITMMSAVILPHCLKTKAHYNNECSHPHSLSENKGTLQWWVQPFSLIVWKQKHSTMMSAAILPHCLKTKAHYNDECSHSPSLSENKGTLQWWVQPFSLIVWKQRHITMMSAAILPHCLKTKAHYNDECSHSPSLSENKDTLQWWVQPFSLIVWKQRHITMMSASILPHCLKTKAHYNDECIHSSSFSENKGTLQWWVQPFFLIVWKQKHITMKSAAILPHCLKTKTHYNEECILFSLIVWKQRNNTMMSAAILLHCLKTKAHYNDECSDSSSLSENKDALQWWVQPFSLTVWKQRNITMMSAAILPHFLKTKAHYNNECSHPPSLSENKGTLQWWVQPFSLIVWKQKHSTMMSAAILPHCLKTKAHYNDECSHSPSLSENKGTLQWWVQPFSLIVWKQRHITMMSAAILPHCLKTKAHYNDECSHSPSLSENKDTLQWWVQPFSLIVWKQRHITMMSASILPHCLKTKAHYNDECFHSSSFSENKGTLQWWVHPFSLIVWKQRHITMMSASIRPHFLKTKAHYKHNV